MTTPSETLQAAADKLDELLAKVTPGPWHIGDAVDPTKPCNVHNFPNGLPVADGLYWLDAEYIARLNPVVGRTLVALLRKVAWMVNLDPDLAARVGAPETLDLARAILGGES